MNAASDFPRIQESVGSHAACRVVSDTRMDIEASPDHLLPAVTAFRALGWGYLAAITGRDTAGGATAAPSGGTGASAGAGTPAPGENGHLEVLYHFCQGPAVATFRVRVPRADPVVPSIIPAFPNAAIYEREVSETLGVRIDGLPKGKRQSISDDWPEGVFPLRKDFSPEAAVLVPNSASAVGSDEAPGTFVVPIGPQHPALKEPEHFEFAVDGEIVTGASIRLGYVHRGIEKGAEDRSWVQNLYLMERVCGICSHIHATAYALGVETLAGMTAPPRAQAIRTLVCELERIHSHLLWLGIGAHEGGFDTLFMYSWRDRETVMDLLETLTGNRVNYSVNLLGGVKCDVDDKIADAIRRGMDFLEKRSKHYLKIVTTDESFLRRTRRVGIISHDESARYATVGPTARASAVASDVRVHAPYAAYGEFPVKEVLDERCDLEARFVVRIEELFECYRVIREILDHLPSGDLAIPAPRKVPEGEVIHRVEAPRGELFYYIRSAGGVKPDRVKVRTPSLSNWAAVVNVVVGHKLADVPMILVGIDPCFSCNDRSIRLRPAGDPGPGERWSWEDLRRHGIRYYGGGPA
jgi:ech hydrogenase subunit E